MLTVNDQVENILGLDRAEFASAIGSEWIHQSGGLSGQLSFGWQDLNQVLQYGNLQPGQVRLVGGDRASGDLFQYAMAGGGRSYSRLVPEVAHDALTSGGTLVIDQLDLINPWADRVARALASLFKTRVQANLYASLVGAPGFGAHKDSHDVFVVQGAGIKHWTIGEDAQAVQLSMKAGDVLYLPEATTHDVATDAVGSLHVTFAIPRLNMLELLEWAVQASTRRVDLRTPIDAEAPDVAAKLVSDPRLAVQVEEVESFLEAHVASSLPASFFNFPYVGRNLDSVDNFMVRRTFIDSLPMGAEHEKAVIDQVSAAQGISLKALLDGGAGDDMLKIVRELVRRGHLALLEP